MADVELSTLGAVIKTAYEAESNTNAFTDTEKTKLAGISGTNTGDQSLFSSIAVSGQTTVVADTTTDTLTLVAGSNITITTNATTDTITIAASGGSGAVDSVNGLTGVVVLDADDIDDTSTTNKFITSAEISKLAGIESSADVTDEANVKAALDGMALTNTTLASTDKILFQDASDSDNLKSAPYSSFLDTGVVGISIDNGASVITTGSKGHITIPYNATILSWFLAADQSGSIVVDIKRSGTSIVGAGNKPTLSTAQSGTATVSSWTSTSITAGDILEFVVDSASTILNVSVVIKLQKV